MKHPDALDPLKLTIIRKALACILEEGVGTMAHWLDPHARSGPCGNLTQEEFKNWKEENKAWLNSFRFVAQRDGFMDFEKVIIPALNWILTWSEPLQQCLIENRMRQEDGFSWWDTICCAQLDDPSDLRKNPEGYLFQCLYQKHPQTCGKSHCMTVEANYRFNKGRPYGNKWSVPCPVAMRSTRGHNSRTLFVHTSYDPSATVWV